MTDTLLTRCAETPLRIGTRTSTMARAQTDHVVTLITELLPGVSTQVVPITVGADRWPGALTDIGGKVAFSKEIDHALICAQIDLAVHCLKDIPGDVPLAEGTAFGAYLPRDDVRDVVITRDGVPLADLPAASRIGTSSVRRRAQLSIHRPDLRIERIRGNVDTRLDKLDEDGRYAALILARTSLSRLGLLDRHHEVLPAEFHPAGEGVVSMVPPVGAGVIALQARDTDLPVMQLLQHLDHPATAGHVLAERTMLRLLRGHCNSPIAGHACPTGDGRMSLYGMVFNLDGSRFVHAHACGDASDPAALGSRVAADLLQQGAGQLIAATHQ
ncbi:hydroxymethylbilane synthase (plasmid) [Streptosporangium sp. CA-135522]|uniref:hydroxymethylbilane synthase n=1 Tax=Streptosporangium sp. CA-135522 TaxID=3240072 RepID=UPI003D8C1818